MIDLAQFDRDDRLARLLRHLPIREPGACWLVEGLWRDKDDYPILCVGPRRLRANRVAYHVWRGPIPTGSLICHVCDTPPCANPYHVYPGSALDNARDRDRASRRLHLSRRRADRAGQLTLPI